MVGRVVMVAVIMVMAVIMFIPAGVRTLLLDFCGRLKPIIPALATNQHAVGG